MMENDDRLTENICQVLDRSLDDLDAVTKSRLTQARYRAMSRPQRKSRVLYWGSVPAAGLLLLVLLLNWPTTPMQPESIPGFDELSILTAAEPLEFYQEEIEFYEWLSEVLEAENELSEHAAPQLDPAVADRSIGSGDRYARSAKPRITRLSGFI